MQILRILALAAVAVTASSPQRPSGPETVAVRAVVDGDTIDVAMYGRIRLAGIRAPRLGRTGIEDEPFARRAQERLEGLISHRFVRLEFPSATSRSTAYVLLDDGTLVNAVLVEEGLARAMRASGPRGVELRRAEERARAARRGQWGAPRELHNSTTPQLPTNAQIRNPQNSQRPKLPTPKTPNAQNSQRPKLPTPKTPK
jgi:endonuclease YncB( thermonuclease family)